MRIYKMVDHILTEEILKELDKVWVVMEKKDTPSMTNGQIIINALKLYKRSLQ